VAVKFGLFVPQGWKMDLAEIDDPVAQFEAMTAVAKAADAEPNWHSIWLYDHFHTVPTPEIETTFECWTTTAALARDTQRVRIGQMTSCNGFRNPALFAKIASTVDVASHGRLDAGLGAGWYQHEWRAYGYGFPETPERMARFREAVEIVHKMWTEERPVFHGKYYSIDGPINEPKGAQQPHIPFWIAGGGERVTLKLVAQYGDACNIGREPDVIRHKLEVLKRHCDALGRNYDEIVKSAEADIVLIDEGTDPDEVRARGDFPTFGWPTLIGTPAQIRAHIQNLVDAGIDYVIVYIPRIAYDREPLHRFAAEVAPQFV
jgi:F420-dependent oxidoreductase-like protein